MSAEQCEFGLLHSTREELRGNLAAEILIDECNTRFGYENPNDIEFICDSKSALKIIESDISSLKQSQPLAADMEVTLEIGRLQKKIIELNGTMNGCEVTKIPKTLKPTMKC